MKFIFILFISCSFLVSSSLQYWEPWSCVGSVYQTCVPPQYPSELYCMQCYSNGPGFNVEIGPCLTCKEYNISRLAWLHWNATCPSTGCYFSLTAFSFAGLRLTFLDDENYQKRWMTEPFKPLGDTIYEDAPVASYNYTFVPGSPNQQIHMLLECATNDTCTISARGKLSTTSGNSPSVNNIWEFGSQTPTNSFRKYDYVGKRSGAGNMQYWHQSGAVDPNVAYNPTDSEIAFADIVYPPKRMSFHPGSTFGTRSAIRFTCPPQGCCQLEYHFWGIDESGVTSDVGIVIGSTQFPPINIGLDTGRVVREINEPAGTPLVFSVGYGVNSNYQFDSTAFEIVVKDCVGNSYNPKTSFEVITLNNNNDNDDPELASSKNMGSKSKFYKSSYFIIIMVAVPTAIFIMVFVGVMAWRGHCNCESPRSRSRSRTRSSNYHGGGGGGGIGLSPLSNKQMRDLTKHMHKQADILEDNIRANREYFDAFAGSNSFPMNDFNTGPSFTGPSFNTDFGGSNF